MVKYWSICFPLQHQKCQPYYPIMFDLTIKVGWDQCSCKVGFPLCIKSYFAKVISILHKFRSHNYFFILICRWFNIWHIKHLFRFFTFMNSSGDNWALWGCSRYPWWFSDCSGMKWIWTSWFSQLNSNP